MKRLVYAMSKELTRGVFWLIDGEVYAYPFYEDSYLGIAKSGMTYNHKNLWKELNISSKPYNYYPRGRVDIDNKGRAIIYLNPTINDTSIISKIKKEFGIIGNNFVISEDYSNHYKCHTEDGWKADKS